MDYSMPGLPVHHQLLEFTQAHDHWVGDAIQPFHPLSSPSPPAFNLSQPWGLFKWVSSLQKMAKVLELSFSISPSNEYSGLISFRMDWLDLLAVQGTLKSLFSNSVIFIIQLSHPYLATGKTIALTRWTFVGKVMSLLFNMLLSDMTEWLHFHFLLSRIGEGNGNPLQCSSLENSKDGGVWWAAIYRVAQSRTWLKWLSSSSSSLFLHWEKP